MQNYTSKDVEDSVKISVIGKKNSGRNGFVKQFERQFIKMYDYNKDYIRASRIYRLVLNYGKFGIQDKILDITMNKHISIGTDDKIVSKYDIMFIICDIMKLDDNDYVKWIKDKIAFIKEKWDWDNTIMDQKVIALVANKIDMKMDVDKRMLLWGPNDKGMGLKCPGEHMNNIIGYTDRMCDRCHYTGLGTFKMCHYCEWHLCEKCLKSKVSDDGKDEEKGVLNSNAELDDTKNDEKDEVKNTDNNEIESNNNSNNNNNDNNIENMKKYCDEEGIYYYEMSIKHERWQTFAGFKTYQDKVQKMVKDIVSKYYIAMYPKTKKSSEGSCDSFGSIFYDTLTIFISFADLVTDLIMLYTYHINGWKAFFVMSIIVIILAQFSYCGLFTELYGPYNKHFVINKKNDIKSMFFNIFLTYI